ncbi:MAG: MATE family efflux transporter [Promicromonosporaceae bacterium]|nr:MATE family efflux transporter [Promicromonosporaceae bacterium]
MQNLTQGSPTKLIATFATPILLGAIFQQVYAFIDAAVVGRFLGVGSLAAVGSPGSLVFLLMGLSWGGSAGLAIPIARAFGAGDLAAVRRFAAAGTYVSVGIAAFITIVGTVFARDLLTLMNTPPEILDESTIFLTTLLGGAAATVALNFLIATIRALGDSRTPLYFLVGSSGLNAVLVTALVGGAGWGVAGAAAATVLSHLVTVIALLFVIRRRMPALQLRREDWIDGRASLAEPLRIGIPMGLQMSTIAVGTLSVQVAVNGMGATTVAAYTAVLRLDNLAVVPLMAFGVAMVTYVAQNRGAHQWRRIRVGVFRTCLVGAGVAVVLGFSLMFTAPTIAGWFVGSDQAQVLDYTRTFFLVNGGLYAILSTLFILRNAVQGMGLASVPTIASLGETLARVLAALVLVTNFGFVGVALAAPLAWLGGLIPIGHAWLRQLGKLKRLEAEQDAGLAVLPLSDDLNLSLLDSGLLDLSGIDTTDAFGPSADPRPTTRELALA